MITKKRIDHLFENLWIGMEYCQEHHYNCLQQFSRIEKLFLLHGKNWNNLLAALDALDGIGITIATGLIWTAYPAKAVPFDKYTTSYCLKLKYINSERISSDYIFICKKIKSEVSKYASYSIRDLVVEAREEMEDSEWLIEPK